MIKMPKELKQRWVDALRSGKYKQAQGALKKDGGYCCLGVLQMVVDGEVEMDLREDRYGEDYAASACLPSEEWCQKNKIEHDKWEIHEVVEDSYGNEDDYYDLPSLNDESCLSFKDIAGIIEEQVEGV